MEFNNNPDVNTVQVSWEDASDLKCLAFSRVRAAIKFFDGEQELLQKELFAALSLFDQTEKWSYKVELVVSKEQFDSFQDQISNFHIADELYLLLQNQFHSTLLNNKWNLSEEEQMKEISSIEKEMRSTGRVLDKIQKNNP